MSRRKCGTCRFFQEAGMAGSGWCNHPQRRPTSDVMLMVRRNELACRNTWDDDLWAPPLVAANPNGHGDSMPDARSTNPVRPERPATEDEIAAALRARSLMPELDIPDPAREDVVVGEGPVMPREPRSRPMAAASRPAPEPDAEEDDRATILAQDTRAAIIKARERHRSRSGPRTRPMALPLSDPAIVSTPDEESAGDLFGEPMTAASPAAPAARVQPESVPDEAVASTVERSEAVAPPPDLPFRPERSVAADPFDSVPERLADVDLPRPSVAPRVPLVAGLDDDLDPARYRPARRIVPPPPDRRLPDPVRPAATAPSRTPAVVSGRPEDRDRLGRDRPADRVPVGANGGARATDARPAVHDAVRLERGMHDHPAPVRAGVRDSAPMPRPAATSPALYRELEPDCSPPQRGRGPAPRRGNGAGSPIGAQTTPPAAATPSFGPVPTGESRFVAADTVVPPAAPVIGVAGGDDIDDAMLNQTVQIAPLVPRMCRTCRDFKPADDGERGWCTNRWAFTHRRTVDAADPEPACQTSLGCWWLPSDRVWSESADVSSHGSPTPLLELFMPHLFVKERPAPPPKRRQS